MPDDPSEDSEDRLRAVTIGEIQPLNGTITLVPYDSSWPSQFAALEMQIRDALGSAALLIEHAGSTSVPGLSAKPIIDIVMAVANAADERSYVPALERIGYVLRIREPDWFEHRLLRPPQISANIHVFSNGCPEILRMLGFRDHLRTCPEDRDLYERAKQALAARTWRHVQNYADAKSTIIAEIMKRAAPGALPAGG